LGEVELICDRIVIMQRGEIIREGDIVTLTQQLGYYMVGLAPKEEFPLADVAKLGYNVVREGELWEVGLKEGQSIDPVVELLRSRGLHLRHLTEKRQTLEDLFIQTVEAAEPGVDRPTAPRRPVKN
jgi:ABC-2 type transport system ATP-binding protein